MTKELFARVLDEELMRIEKEVGAAKFASGKYKEAAVLFAKECTVPVLDDFLTLDAYRYIVTHTSTCWPAPRVSSNHRTAACSAHESDQTRSCSPLETLAWWNP